MLFYSAMIAMIGDRAAAAIRNTNNTASTMTRQKQLGSL
jgi:hypothetical protein